MNKENNQSETLLTFPCDFTIKVFGPNNQEFESAVLTLLNKHFPHTSDYDIQTRASSNSKYRALSITLHIDSKEQLDNIYQDLSDSPVVLMAL